MTITRILLSIVGLLILIGVVAIGWSLVTGQSSPTSTTTSSGGLFPDSGSSGSNTQGSTQSGGTSGTTSVTDRSGASVPVSDFINNGTTIPDTQNPGNYELAGSLGYCLPNAKCAATATTDYNIGYEQSSDTFTVALLKEPIGQVRDEAEQFLLSKLGITKSQLCGLKYFVGTTYYVNEHYDSQNLGFAGCPGAVTLPN